MSSANSLAVDCKLSGRSFVSIRKSNGHKIEPWGTPLSTYDKLEHWSLRTTTWNLLLKKLLSRLKDSQPAITYSKLTIEALEQGVKYVQS